MTGWRDLCIAALFVLCAATFKAQAAPTEDGPTQAVRRMYAAYERKDAAAYAAAWLPGAEGLSERLDTLKGLWAKVGPIRLTRLETETVQQTASSRTLKVSLTLEANDLKTGQPSPMYGKMVRLITLTNRKGVWKVSDVESGEVLLYQRLVHAGTPAKQRELMAQSPELLNATLMLGACNWARSYASQGLLDSAHHGLHLIHMIADAIGTPAAQASGWETEGFVMERDARYVQARDAYRRAVDAYRAAGDKDAASTAELAIKNLAPYAGGATAGVTRFTPELALQIGHQCEVLAVTRIPGSDLLASGAKDNTIILWNSITGQQVRTLTAHRGNVYALSASPDGRWLASGSVDKSVCIWNIETGALEEQLTGLDLGVNQSDGIDRMHLVMAVCYSPNGRYLAIGTGEMAGDAFHLTAHGQVRIWDCHTHAVVRVLAGSSPVVQAVAWSPDGKWLVASGENGAANVWDFSTGKLIRTLTGHTRQIVSVAVSPDGKSIATSSEDETMRLWSANTGVCEHVIKDMLTRGNALEFTRDSARIVAVCQSAAFGVWDVASGALIGKAPRGGTAVGTTLCLMNDGKSVAAGSIPGRVCFYDLPTLKPTRATTSHMAPLYNVAFSPDGKRLVAGGLAAQVWRLSYAQSAPLERTLSDMDGHATAISPDGKLLAWSGTVGSDEAHINAFLGKTDGPLPEGKVRLIDLATGATIRETKTGTTAPTILTFSPNGKLLAAGGDGTDYFLIEVESGKIRWRRKSASLDIGSLAFSPDSLSLLVAAGKTYLTDTQTGAAREVRSGQACQCAVFSPTGDRIAAAHPGSNSVEVLAAKTYKSLLTLRGPLDYIRSLTFSPNGRMLAACSFDGTVRLWHTDGTELVRTFRGHASWVNDVAFSPDGTTLASVGIDGTARLWNVSTGIPLTTLIALDPDKRAPNEQMWMAITPQGYYDCAIGADEQVQWRISNTRLEPCALHHDALLSPKLIRQALAGKPADVEPFQVTRIVPACRFMEPADKADVSGRTVKVSLFASAATGLSSVDYYVNGELQTTGTERPLFAESRYRDLAAGIAVPAGHTVRGVFEDTLAPDPEDANLEISAHVRDKDGNSCDDMVRVHRTDVNEKLPNLYALCIGVSQYRKPSFNLDGPADDARELAELLKAQKGSLYTEVNVRTLLDRDATRQGVQEALNTLKGAGKRDVVLVFVAGHGIVLDNRSYFAPFDIMNDDVENTGVTWQQILDVFQDGRGANLLFADACHSGLSLAAGAKSQTSAELENEVRRHGGLMMMAACRGDQFSRSDPASHHGLFTLALLEALRGKADLDRDGKVSLSEMTQYVTTRVKELSEQRQEPVIVERGGIPPTLPLAKPR